MTIFFVATLTCQAGETNRVLRIAADPNNLPFSNDKREGFENRIADVIARDLGAQIQYSWRAQRRGFFRETLKENTADLVLGVPKDFERALTTQRYYQSSYVFVSRRSDALELRTLSDPQLRRLKLGVHLIGDDGANTPPAHALAERGIVTNVVGFSIYGDYAEPNPPARIIKAVADQKIDVAIVWGPWAGYFAPRASVPLKVSTIEPLYGTNDLPMSFEISLGVRNGNKELRDELDRVLVQRRDEIQKILNEFGVPQIPGAPLVRRREDGR